MIILYMFILGAVIGSFLNVCIYRLPEGKSVVHPPSSCGSCGQQLKSLDLVPIFSWVLLKGKCRHCGAKVSGRYALVEAVTGLLFLWAYIQFGLSFDLLRALVLVSFLLVMIFIDLDHQLILDGYNLLFALCGAVFLFLPGSPDWKGALLGALAGGIILFVIALVGPMGGGDVKFMAAAGIWLGLWQTVMALYVGFIVGGLISLLLVVFKIKKRKDFIPFGPFLAIGVFAAQFYFNEMIDLYMKLL